MQCNLVNMLNSIFIDQFVYCKFNLQFLRIILQRFTHAIKLKGWGLSGISFIHTFLNIKLIYCKLVYSVINGIKLKFLLNWNFCLTD